MGADAKKLVEIIYNIAEKIIENREYLTELDSAIGDADHGINMSKGFKAVLEKLPAVSDKDCGTILKTVGMTLVSSVGGASGPLYGTAFMKAGQVVAGKGELDFADMVSILEAALDGIKARGKAERGEKTMVDTIEPVVDVLKAAQGQKDLAKILEGALAAGQEGMVYTKGIIAKKGRASYLGERSIGHQDPGATSSYIILSEVFKAITP